MRQRTKNGEESDKRKQKKDQAERKISRLMPVFCILGGVILYGILTLNASGQDVITEGGRILRENHGGEEQEYQIWVDGLCEEEVAVDVRIRPQRYTREEAERTFEEIMDQMEASICKENPSLMEVRSDLSLPSRLDGGVKLRWHSSDRKSVV